YYDFSGYSDMAIGLGRMFGFEFKENFNRPYLSVSIKDFWRRWHISLSTWFKEYLYIPLGGNRKGEFRAAMNRICVFFLCGLWHGASWTFVLWGLYHGAFLMLEQYIKPLQRLPRWLGHVYAIVVVTVGFVLFRADTLGQAGAIIALMFTGSDVTAASLSILFEQLTPLFIAMFALGVVAVAPWPDMARRFVDSHGIQAQARVASYVGALVLLVLALLELSAGGYNPFIYFRF
ncbi:MAG: MBOAT family O-acyltransferase, partial [Coriobacteriaceae bacterium]|nr:MBOAT family O-acyltransferase [Coriobacteriaceae bacterium]